MKNKDNKNKTNQHNIIMITNREVIKYITKKNMQINNKRRICIKITILDKYKNAVNYIDFI